MNKKQRTSKPVIKEILLPEAIKKELCQRFNAERHRFNNALRYVSNSSIAQSMRYEALKKGGRVFLYKDAPKGYRAIGETTFQEGVMTQKFGDRVTLGVSLTGGGAWLRIEDDEQKCIYNHGFPEMTVDDLMSLQYSIENVLNQMKASNPKIQ